MKYGEHVFLLGRKPEVFIMAPTYIKGGSNLPFARQGGFDFSGFGLFLPEGIEIKLKNIRKRDYKPSPKGFDINSISRIKARSLLSAGT